MAGQRLNRFWTNSKKDETYFPDGSGKLIGAIKALLLQLKIVCPEKFQFRTANYREIPMSDQIGCRVNRSGISLASCLDR